MGLPRCIDGTLSYIEAGLKYTLNDRTNMLLPLFKLIGFPMFNNGNVNFRFEGLKAHLK